MKERRTAAARIEWPLVGALAVLSVVLGAAGFQAHRDYAGYGALDLLYLSLQLFALNSGNVSPPAPWALGVARLLAPGLAAYAAVRVLAALLRDQIARVRLRRFRDHIVIAGAGRLGGKLAAGFRTAGADVVVLDVNPAALGAAACRDAGAITIVADATDAAVLESAGARRARAIIAAVSDDGANAAIAMAARSLAGASGGEQRTRCCAFVSDPALAALLREAELRRPDVAGRIEFIDVFERGARALLERFPIVGPGDPVARPHLLLVGIGRFAEALWLQAARSWWFDRGGSPLLVTIVDPGATSATQAIVGRYPGLMRASIPTAIDADVREPGFERAVSNLVIGTPPSLACICLGDEPSALVAALTLHRESEGKLRRIVVRTAAIDGLAAHLEDTGMHPFSLADETCRPSLVLADLMEQLAISLHREHARARRAAGELPTPSSSSAPWSVLADEFRESSRAQARALLDSVRRLGWELRLSNDWSLDAPPLPEAVVEAIARDDHERYLAERRHGGWTYGAERDDHARTNPLLVAWDQLPLDARQRQLAAAAALPRMLAREGFELVQR